MPAKESTSVIETILTRRSVREFTGRPVNREEINTILNAGRFAPSGLNNQPWRYVVIQNPEAKENLSRCTHYSGIVAGAPLLIAVFLDTEHSYSRTKDIQAVGASIENMLLACCGLGLGGVWLGEILNQSEQVNSILECPAKLELMAVLAIGEPVPGKRASSRKPLEEIAFEEKFGKKWAQQS